MLPVIVMVQHWSWYFLESKCIKASNENTKEIETIEARNKPSWLPPDPFLSLGVRARLIYERFRSRSEI